MILARTLARWAQSRPGRVALTAGEGVTLSYGTLWALLRPMAAELQATGCRRLAVLGDNGLAWALTDLAAGLAGLTVIPIPAFFSASQVAHVLRLAAPERVLVTPPELADRLPANCRPAHGPALGDGAAWWAPQGAASAPLPDLPAKLTFTSGTTGTPKGIGLTWPAMEAVVASLAGVLSRRVGVRKPAPPGDGHLALLPLSLLLENLAGLYLGLHRGATVHLPPPATLGLQGAGLRDAGALLRGLATSGARTAIATPHLLQALTQAVAAGGPRPTALRFLAVGGARVSPVLLAQARELGLPAYEGYGLTEAASVVALNAPGADLPGSTGQPLAHAKVQIRDDGEIWVAGSLLAGQLTETGWQAYTEPWWPTGDHGELTAGGFLRVHGRRRQILITSLGRNVAPEWLESELLAEPQIRQAVVFGEALPACVALLWPAPGAEVEILAALARTNARLPDYARIAAWRPLPAPMTPASGLLSPNGRPRREAIAASHAPLLAALAAELAGRLGSVLPGSAPPSSVPAANK